MIYLQQLYLNNFRNYSSVSLEFSPHLNFFIGRNGSGKTNLLESISLLMIAKSFRTPHLKELIRHDEKSFGLSSNFKKNEINQSLRISYGLEKKNIIHNETNYSSFLPLIGILQGIVFAGYQNQLIKGSPMERRRFLDLQSAQVDPLYIHHLNRYRTAMKHRNQLLRQKDKTSIDIFEEIMSKSACYLIKKRLSSIQELYPLANEYHNKLIQREESIHFSYQSHCSLGNISKISPVDYQQAFLKSRYKDQEFGQTSLGPHKDDLKIILNKEDAKKYASEGQIQSLMTSLYLAEYDRLNQKINQRPILCVDDIEQSLDRERLLNLFQILEQMGQVFITLPQLPKYKFKRDCRVFEIDKGSIKAFKN